MEKRYFKNIDFLRFIFAIIIVTSHMIGSVYERTNALSVFNYLSTIQGNMSTCVEFFFIISGFFFVLTFKKELSTMQFLKNKFIRLTPVIVFTLILFLIIAIFKITKFYFMDNIFSIFFLNGLMIVNHHSPYGGLGNDHSSWYVSVLVFVSFLYFTVIKNYGYKLLNTILPLLIVICLYWQSFEATKILPMFLIRGLYCVGIGILLGQFYLKYRKFLESPVKAIRAKVLLTLLEGGVIGYLFYGVITTKSHLMRTDLIFLFIVLFILFIKRGGFFSKVLDNNFSVKLGAYAYSIYITHNLWLDILKKYLFTPEIAQNHANYIGGGVIFAIIICVIFGCITYYLVERPCSKYLKERFK